MEEKRRSQMLKGVLDMCLLALIAQAPCYGYEMVQKLAHSGLDLVSEGSIYPVLSRLQQHSYIEGYLVDSAEGPPRKYYRILPPGRAQLQAWAVAWQTVASGVNCILEGGLAHESA